MKLNADLSSSIAGAMPLFIIIASNVFGVNLGADGGDLVSAIVIAFVAHFVGKPSEKASELEAFLQALSGAAKIKDIVKEIGEK